MMRTLTKWNFARLVLFLGLFLLIKASIGQTQESGLDTKQQTVKYTQILAARAVAEEVKDKNILGLVSDCSEDILDPTKINAHRNRAKSEKKAQEYVKKRLQEALEEDLVVVYQSFMTEGIRFSKEQFIAEVRNKFQGQINDGIRQNLNQNFQGVFKQARKQAVGKQLAKLSLNVYPDETNKVEPGIREFEDAYVDGWKKIDTNRLTDKLLLRIKRKRDIFLEEINQIIQRAVGAILDDVRSQMVMQKGALDKKLSDDLITKNQLRFAIEGNIGKLIAREKNERPRIQVSGEKIHATREIPRTIYGIFSFIQREVSAEVKNQEKERFRKFCQNIKGLSVAKREELGKIIRGDLKAHRATGKSKTIIVSLFLSDVEKRIMARYVGKAPAGEQDEFRQRLEEYLSVVREDIKQRCAVLVEPDFKAVRDAISDEQLKKVFPKVADRSWEVPKLAKKEHKQKVDIMKRIKGLSKKRLNVSTFEHCINVPIKTEICEARLNQKELLEETEEKVCHQTQFLIDEGGRAWDGQYNIYLAHQESIQEAPRKWIFLKKEMKGDLNKGKEYWVRHFTDKIKGIWSKNREALIWQGNAPAYGRNKYLPLYDYIEKEIEKRLNTDVGNILIEIQKEKERLLKEIREDEIQPKPVPPELGVTDPAVLSEREDEIQPKPVPPEPRSKIAWWWLLLLALAIVAVVWAVIKRRTKPHRSFDGWVSYFNSMGMTGEPLPGGGFRYDMGTFEILIRPYKEKT